MLKHKPHLNPKTQNSCLAVHVLNEHCATSELTALNFKYNHFLFLTVLNSFKIIIHFYCCDYFFIIHFYCCDYYFL